MGKKKRITGAREKTIPTSKITEGTPPENGVVKRQGIIESEGYEGAQRNNVAGKKRVKAKITKKTAKKSGMTDEDIPINEDYSFLENVTINLDKKKYFKRPILSKAEIAEIRKKMNDDMDNVKKLMEKLEDYFHDKVEQIGINKKEFELTIPIEYQSLKFVTILALHPAWIFIKCKVMDLEDVPEKMRFEIYERVLVANFELNAVFYSIDHNKSGVWVENDLPVPGLNLDAFEVDFNAIIFGIKYFVDNIAIPLNQQMKSTYDSTGMYT